MNSKDEPIFDQLINFIINERWEYDFELNRSIRLYSDLKIWGDDAVDFFIKFRDKFGVDISHFKLDEYFDPEGFDMISFFSSLFNRGVKRKKKEITLGDLEKAIILGKLDETVVS